MKPSGPNPPSHLQASKIASASRRQPSRADASRLDMRATQRCARRSFPGGTVRDDQRYSITPVRHERNLGPTATFNLLFKNASEPYLSSLEDDNWWDPDFLQEMVSTLDRFPDVDVGWCNQRCWREEPDGTWTDLHRTVWQVEGNREPRLIFWPQPYQITGALHSNGSMLLRSRHAAEYRIPDETPFDIIELVRERTFNHPIMFVPQTLANFSITKESARTSNTASGDRVSFCWRAVFSGIPR